MNNKQIKYNDVPQVDNIKDLVKFGVKKDPDKKFLVYHNDDGKECTKTFKDSWNDITNIGTFLFKRGLSDCKIALIGENTFEWVYIFFAVFLGKNVFVPLDREMPAEDLAEQLILSGCKALFYSEKSKDKVDVFKTTEGMPIEQYFTIDDFDKYCAEGQKALDEGYTDFIDQEVKSSDLASIVFTSGTTGKSKGVMLTHGNLMADVLATCQCVSAQHTVLFLPFHHTFAWVSLFSAFVFNEYGYLCKDYRNVVKDFKNYQPQHFMAVPLVIEKIYMTIWRTAEKTGKAPALRVGMKISRFLITLGIDKRNKLFSMIHEHLGGNLELIICGGAALDLKYEKGLYDMGILVLNGYGITECSPVVTVNRVSNFKLGSIGLPLPCNEIKIVEPDEDGVGEIFVKGSNVMVGYYNDPETTAKVFDGEWFKTGDYGRIDKEGFLFFVGRKKNLIVLANGKNVSPEELEDKLKKIPYVKEVIVYEEKKHIVAEF
ncbi:MAG: AMP-binding protein, partial [Eubacteriales bacterium]